MQIKNVLGRAGLALACWGMAAPHSVALAADRVATTKTAATNAARPSIVDVALGADGNLTGKVLDAQGKAVEGAPVVVRQGTREIARTETNEAGSFQVGGLRGGVYQIGADKNVETFRVWTKKAAPPSARETALIVSKPQSQVVRGQVLGGGELAALAGVTGVVAGATGVVIGVNANNNAQNAQDDADQANEKLNAYINATASTTP